MEERTRQEEEVGPRRGDFTRQEYLRRHQLKLMEDLDKVLRQKPTTVRALKKGRPKTVFCDDSALARSPVKGLLGESCAAEWPGEQVGCTLQAGRKSVKKDALCFGD